MTSRERVMAAIRGGDVDRRPTVAWPTPGDSDVVIVDTVEALENRDSEKVTLLKVSNPFFRSLRAGMNLNALCHDDPEAGDVAMSKFQKATEEEISAGLEAGADGIFYVVHGASPAHCSPMQFGGLYLENDREALSKADGAAINIAYIVGDAESYLDFVSDLPAHVMGWDVDSTGFSVAQMRALRSGAILANDANAELELITGLGGLTVAQYLEGNGALAYA